jgi:hypothetical protein
MSASAVAPTAGTVMESAAWQGLVRDTHNYIGMYASYDLNAQLSPTTKFRGGSGWSPASNNSEFVSEQYRQLVNDASITTDQPGRRKSTTS